MEINPKELQKWISYTQYWHKYDHHVNVYTVTTAFTVFGGGIFLVLSLFFNDVFIIPLMLCFLLQSATIEGIFSIQEYILLEAVECAKKKEDSNEKENKNLC